ncbi:MAG: beta-galactosidase [Candidatus Binataceae bacterium]
MLISGAGAYGASPGGSAASIAGIYAVGRLNPKVTREVLANRNVDGLTLRYWWRDVEPSEGAFDWGKVDRDIAEARSYGKKVSLTVGAGYGTPPWVFTDGAQPFTFRWTMQWGPPVCSEQRIPVPWDLVFLSKWRAFVREFGRKYDSNPAVVLIKLTGVNSATAETNLPRQKGKMIERKGTSCASSDDIAEWRQLGYTDQKVASAWTEIADTFAQSFPHKKFALQTGPNSLPNLNAPARGRRRGGGGGGRVKDQQPENLANEGISRYDGQFVVQNNFLSAFRNWEELAQYSKRTATGDQMLWWVTGDKNCRMNHKIQPCDPRTVMQAAINRGIDAGAIYLEIYTQDILNPNLQDLLASTHQRLAPR